MQFAGSSMRPKPHVSIIIAPISEADVESFRECLDVVAREKEYLAQGERRVVGHEFRKNQQSLSMCRGQGVQRNLEVTHTVVFCGRQLARAHIHLQ